MGLIAAYNEAAARSSPACRTRVGRIVNAQIALDTIALTALLHFAGGLTSIGILFFAPAFCAYGASLPVTQAFVHVSLATMELAALGVAERYGLIPHQPLGFYLADAYRHGNFIALTVVYLSTVNGLCAYLTHYLSQLLSKEEEQSRLLASERGVLLARNEREAACVRALLDVAQHVSAIHTVDQLLHAVCDTTVALVRVPRVEIFLWDAARSGLTLAAARGLAHQTAPDNEKRYGAELPIVARLRAGEVVQFGAGPSLTLAGGRIAAPFRRGFAAPMVCRDSFEGALFVGYDDENAEELMALVQGIARQAALALVNVRALEQQQEDAEVSRVLLEISQGLSACLDEDALWTMLVRGANEVLGLPWSIATRFDEHAGSFTVAGASGVADADVRALADARFRLEDLPRLQESLSSGDLVVSESTPRPFAVPPGLRVGSWVGIPLVRGGWVAGFLSAGTGDPKKSFSRRQLRLAEGLGHHASIALQNARLVADLEAADRLKSEFVSTMSHELRTPLNVIIGYTEMLREGAVGPITTGQLALIDRLDARGRELLELIEATLHVGRLEAGRDTVELAAIDVPELVRALQASTAGLPRPTTVAFDWEVPVDPRAHRPIARSWPSSCATS
jgi:GAF domain-containing protein